VLRTYIYDTNTLDSTGFSQNVAGRLAAVKYPAQFYTPVINGTYYPVQPGAQMNDMYSYTPAGLPAAKRLQVNQPVTSQNGGGTATANLDSTYTYNVEGEINSMSYPGTGWTTGLTPGPSYNYSYDSMYRLSGMTQSGTALVNNVSYNAANQLLTMTFGSETETRGYNTLNQMITLNVQSVPWGTVENQTYSYPLGTNTGKVSSISDTVSGETVTYAYDSLNRLLTATASSWGQQYVFDAFGNLLQKEITAGSPPSLSQAVNAANNQIVGQSYDANGNTLIAYNNGLAYGLGYDPENRLTAAWVTSNNAQFVDYAYDAQNRRIWSWPGTEDTAGNMINYTVNFYTPGGKKLGAYTLTPAFAYENGTYTAVLDVVPTSNDEYFGSRRLATLDRLGSAGRQGIWEGTYYPWGEAKGSSNPKDTWNYATYWQDSVTGLDYANNRYYSNAFGRFITPDPYQASVGPADPGSWNRYAYTRGDPANRNDPSGLCDSDDPSCVSQCDPADPICVAANGCDPADASCSLGSAGGGTSGNPSVPGSITYPVNGGPGDIGSLTVSLTGGGFTFQFADAADGALILGVCAAQPEICAILAGSGLLVYIAVQNWSTFSQALENATQPKSWPACIPPVGTIGYRLDRVPPSRPHHPFTGDHVNLYKMNQNPNNGQCFWQYIGTQAPPPPPGAVPMGPPAGGSNP
jgi:RHS repeat-associated protein